MPSNDTRLLRCIAKGAALPTKVLISVNADVDDLKLMVYKKYKRSTLHGADITELLVWQLKNPEPIIPEGSLHSRVLTQGPLSTIAVNLESISKIGDIFKDQPELENLHIVVQRVTSRECIYQAALSLRVSTIPQPLSLQVRLTLPI